ncbi:hypothetical protein [Clostridium sp. C8-1-8]|uniref:hypothetical protein n=1 Tax=Clostridium sp. C8-1-8 TaxID=2698831 RepID=UPI00136F2FC1|nr:hypothetical protein [Clostridium sp. C8-1-8]
MKKITLFIISLTLSLGLITGCSYTKTKVVTKSEPVNTSKQEQDIREKAYNQLSTKDKERIAGTWKDGKLSKVVLKEGMGNLKDKSYIGKEVYSIDFPTKSNAMPNNMIVFFSTDNIKFIGYGLVD